MEISDLTKEQKDGLNDFLGAWLSTINGDRHSFRVDVHNLFNKSGFTIENCNAEVKEQIQKWSNQNLSTKQ